MYGHMGITLPAHGRAKTRVGNEQAEMDMLIGPNERAVSHRKVVIRPEA